jgi:outer membrane phospholipase A
LKALALAFALFLSSPAWAAPEWALATAKPRIVAGDQVEVVLVSLGGAALPDEVHARLKQGVEERVIALTATGPAQGAQRTYSFAMPPASVGPVTLELAEQSSSVLVLLVDPPKAAAEAGSPRPRETIELPISENDPMYFIVGGREGSTAKFQLSFKYRLFDQSAGFGQDQPWLSGFYFAYTQTSIWDLSEQSKPFRDTNYRPSLFWYWQRTDNKTWIDGVRAGIEHESNGRGDIASRSIDTVFVRPEWRWKFADDSRLDFTPKFYGYVDKSDNPDIDRYRGYTDWRVRYDTGVNWIGTGVARYASSGRGSLLLDLSRRIRDLRIGPVGGYLHFQFFTGYGEELLDYNQRRSTQLRIGFSIVP